MSRLLKGLPRWLPLSLCLLAGCALEPDSPVFLSGTVLEADGTPWRGGPLTLLRPRPVPGTTPPEVAFEPWAAVTPDEEGLFLQRLRASDTGADEVERPTPWADVSAFQLQLPPRGDGSRDLLAFKFTRDVDLPPLRPWASAFRGEPVPGGLRLSWEPVPPTADIPELGYFVEVRGATGRVWVARSESGGSVVAPEWLEDFSDGQVRLQASTWGVRTWLQTTLEYRPVHDAPPVSLPFAGRLPASRGVNCAVGKRVIEPCPLTDGKLDAVTVPGPGTALATEMLLLFPEALQPRRAVLRGLTTASLPGEVLHVEGSLDGTTWVMLGESPTLPDPYTRSGPYVDAVNAEVGNEYFIDLELKTGGPQVTQVRLWLDRPDADGSPASFKSSLNRIREVSIFTGP